MLISTWLYMCDAKKSIRHTTTLKYIQNEPFELEDSANRQKSVE